MNQKARLSIKPQPLRPYVGREQIEAFLDAEEAVASTAPAVPAQPSGHTTGSPLIDAVLRAMPLVKPLKAYTLAQYLAIHPEKMTGAIEIITGLRFAQLHDLWLSRQVARLQAQNPKASPDEIARQLGLGDRSTLWHLRHRDVRPKQYKKLKQILQSHPHPDTLAILEAEVMRKIREQEKGTTNSTNEHEKFSEN